MIGKYYKLSGKFNLPGVMLALMGGIVSVVILSFVYSYASWYIPFIYLNVLITVGFGAVLGYVVGRLSILGKNRNVKIMAVSGLLIGLLALCFQWVTFIYVVTEQGVIMLDPSQVIKFIGILAEEGSWTLRSTKPTGAFLYAVWIIEGIIIVGATVFTTIVVGGSKVFCEKCDKWANAKDQITMLEPIEDKREIEKKVDGGQYDFITKLKKVPAGSENYTKIELEWCPTCERLFMFSLMEVTIEVDKKGKREENEDVLIKRRLIDLPTYAEIKELKNAELVETVEY